MATKNGTTKKTAPKNGSKAKVVGGFVTTYDGLPFGVTDMKILSVMPVGQEVQAIAVSEYKGKKYATVRRFYKKDDAAWLPAKAGVTMTPEVFDAFVSTLNSETKRIKGLLAE